MYNKEDFSKVRNNPFALKTGQKMWEKYPELRSYKWLSTIPRDSFSDNSKAIPDLNDLDGLMRFIVLFVERYNNPISSIKNFDKRAELCWELLETKPFAGCKVFVEEDHFWFHEVLFEYFCYCNDDQYELWFSLKMQYRNNMRLLRTPLGPDSNDSTVTSRNRISKESENTWKQIQDIEFRLFGDKRLLSIINERAMQTNRYAEKFAQEYVPVQMQQFN